MSDEEILPRIQSDLTSAMKSRDADTSGSPQPSNLASLSMDITFTLEDREGKLVHQGKLTADASREFEISLEHTSGLLKEEMIDRTAQRLERLVRKKLKRR